MTTSLRLKGDKRLRDKLFTAEAYSHPAKGHLGMWQAIIEKYTQLGDTILDPMSGVGATLTAALMGRNVVCVELEPHFVEPMRASWEKMKQHPMLGYSLGEVVILRGDARCLPIGSADDYEHGALELVEEVKANEDWSSRTYRFTQIRKSPSVDDDIPPAPVPSPSDSGAVDAIITSPPWEDKTALQDSQWLHDHEAELAEGFRQRNPGKKGNPGNTKPENRSTREGYTMETCFCICHGTSQHIRDCRHCHNQPVRYPPRAIECTSGLEHDYGSCADGCHDGYTRTP